MVIKKYIIPNTGCFMFNLLLRHQSTTTEVLLLRANKKKQSLPLFTMCFIRSEKSEHQAFLEKVMNPDKGFGPN